MRKVLLIPLSLVLALGGWSAAFAEDGFYVVPAMKRNYAPVPKTGQTTPYGTGSDGDLKKGVAWPTPRFIDNLNGTVTDKLTGLIWTKNANIFGSLKWLDSTASGSPSPACEACAQLNSGEGELTDGSVEGDWRLPNALELQSLVDYGKYLPSLPTDYPFTNISSSNPLWSSSSDGEYTWVVQFDFGSLIRRRSDSPFVYVWCVRGGP